jgi:hypothetical protein
MTMKTAVPEEWVRGGGGGGGGGGDSAVNDEKNIDQKQARTE